MTEQAVRQFVLLFLAGRINPAQLWLNPTITLFFITAIGDAELIAEAMGEPSTPAVPNITFHAAIAMVLHCDT